MEKGFLSEPLAPFTYGETRCVMCFARTALRRQGTRNHTKVLNFMPISILYLHLLALLFCLCSQLGVYLVCCLDGLVYLVALFALCHEFV